MRVGASVMKGERGGILLAEFWFILPLDRRYDVIKSCDNS